MAKRKTIFSAGCYYHVYNRGAYKNLIFRERDNYLFLLKRLKQYSDELDISVIAYCLMPNHYHLLLRQNSESSISSLIQRLFNSYSKAYAAKYEISGGVFEGRFKSILVDREAYLLQLCRYIHANPRKDGLVADLQNWEFSNYHEWTKSRDGTLVDHEFVDAYFGDRDRYVQFADDYFSKHHRIPGEMDQYLLD
ncbi:MAG: transposase [Planctomycetes bacterium]|nr:transposase [Planctomycetota bacterium]